MRCSCVWFLTVAAESCSRLAVALFSTQPRNSSLLQSGSVPDSAAYRVQGQTRLTFDDDDDDAKQDSSGDEDVLF